MASRFPAMAGVALLILVTLSCTESASGPNPTDIRVLNPVALPAQSLWIASPGFVGRSLPTVQLGGIELAVSAFNDTTINARLPDTSGTFEVRVTQGADVRTGEVRIVGIAGVRELPPLGGWPVSFAPGSPVVFAVGRSGLVRVDMTTGVVTDLGIPHSSGCVPSAGPSFRGDAVITVVYDTAAHACSRPVVWGTNPVAPLGTSPLPYGPDRYWVELSGGAWAGLTQHFMVVYRNGAAAPWDYIEDNQALVFSADGARAAVPGSRGMGIGMPVIETATGRILSRSPLYWSEAMAFSLDGTSIYQFGGGADAVFQPEQQLVVASAATGRVQAAVPTDSIAYMLNLVVDPDGDWLYAMSYGNAPRIYVFRRSTLSFVAVLQTPGFDHCRRLRCAASRLAIDPVTRRLHVLIPSYWQLLNDVEPPSYPPPADPQTIGAALFSFDLQPADAQQPLALQRP